MAQFLVIALLIPLIVYPIYQRLFHPLRRFPGPFWASITDLWQVHMLRKGDLPQSLCRLHEKYGPIVRIGPNELSFNGSHAIDHIYKAGRNMRKGPLYDGFTSFKPNVFGLRDEMQHSLRRRQMAHSFSVTALRTMEPLFDHTIQNLLNVLDYFSKSGQAFDLKDLISRYQYDLMGTLAFDDDFGALMSAHPASSSSPLSIPVPVFNNHFYLAHIYGMVPTFLPWSMRLAQYVPISWMRELVKTRALLKQHTINCVKQSLKASERQSDRSLLSYVIEAQDPDTGARLNEVDICTEAFGFLVAGSLTTSNSITLLFSYLISHPHALDSLVHELDKVLQEEPLGNVYKFNGLESRLPYTSACIKENFRMATTTSIPLQRQISPLEGMNVCGEHLPCGTLVTIVPHTIHHNPLLWGNSHDVFDPSRWLNGSDNGLTPADPSLLMHFGAGHRVCMGRNLATMSIWKVVISLLKRYTFDAIGDTEFETSSLGMTERKGPLLVRVSIRDSALSEIILTK